MYSTQYAKFYDNKKTNNTFKNSHLAILQFEGNELELFLVKLDCHYAFLIQSAGESWKFIEINLLLKLLKVTGSGRIN